jgi:hypothetical protein
MRGAWGSIFQLTVMAAIVTTLMCGPVGALLAWFCFAVLDISLHAFVTFGGALNGFQGLLVWWALGFLPALAYAAYVLPCDFPVCSITRKIVLERANELRVRDGHRRALPSTTRP